MRGSLFRFVMAGLLSLAVSAATFRGRAAGDDCVHMSSCPENDVDHRGCCLKPQEPKIGTLMGPPASTLAGCPADMVRVPGGTFLMGSPPGVGDEDEYPRHPVPLSGYCIDRTEVTVAAYARCVALGKCAKLPEPGENALTSLCNGTRADRQNHPVNCVDWSQAVAYCTSINKRLPSEAEWEYAARGRQELTYPWGNDAPSAGRLNACGSECRSLKNRLGYQPTAMYQDSDKWETTAPVGSFPRGASPFGALDMPGNVAEWTNDLYAGYTGTASRFNDGPHHVIRGGAWNEAVVSRVRGASRNSRLPGDQLVDVGFRCARGQ